MPITRTTGVLITLLLAAACGSTPGGPPDIVVDRSACSHCTMLISEPRYAAAYEAPGADAKVFDDIGCLLQAAQKESATGLRYWFHDGNDGTWIDGDPVFVVSPEFRTPMAGGIIAYRDGAGAEQAAGAHRGRVVRSLPELIKEKGERK
jgi:copper chaperone NosL